MMVPANPAKETRFGPPRARPTGPVQVVMARDLNLGGTLESVNRLGVGRVVELPAFEAEAWCAAGWARRLPPPDN